MAISKQKKSKLLVEIKKRLTEARTVVFVNFHRLPVAAATVLRRELAAQAVDYLVTKKTLLNLALRELSAVGGERPDLIGEVALATSAADDLAPPRGLNEFIKKQKEGLKILGGIFAGSYVSADRMMELATIPPRATLYAQLLNLFNSPLVGVARVISEIAKLKV